VQPPPKNEHALHKCMAYLGHLTKYAEDADKALKAKTVAKALESIAKISAMLRVIYSSKYGCKIIDADWETIKKMADAWS